jgi:hypothetical protein
MNTQMPLSQIGAVIRDRPVSEVERKLRVELAAAFRIAQHLRWNLDTLNHITLRIPDTDTFLMNPLDLAWEEIKASSLVIGVSVSSWCVEERQARPLVVAARLKPDRTPERCS